MASPYYESDRALSEYLLFHYGTAPEILPGGVGPADALGFATRCVTECVDVSSLPRKARALDLGCAVGRSSFELARFCTEVFGIDRSSRFIEAARAIQAQGFFEFSHIDEGELGVASIAKVPADIDRGRVTFEEGDAMQLRSQLGTFDLILLANLVDRLPDPRRCLAALPALIKPGGQLVVTSPYTWLEEYTPRANWLGGYSKAGRIVRSIDGLSEVLMASFELRTTTDLPFLIREHRRKFQWSVAQASCWVRRSGAA